MTPLYHLPYQPMDPVPVASNTPLSASGLLCRYPYSIIDDEEFHPARATILSIPFQQPRYMKIHNGPDICWGHSPPLAPTGLVFLPSRLKHPETILLRRNRLTTELEPRLSNITPLTPLPRTCPPLSTHHLASSKLKPILPVSALGGRECQPIGYPDTLINERHSAEDADLASRSACPRQQHTSPTSSLPGRERHQLSR